MLMLISQQSLRKFSRSHITYFPHVCSERVEAAGSAAAAFILLNAVCQVSSQWNAASVL